MEGIKIATIAEFRGTSENPYKDKVYYNLKIEQGISALMVSVPVELLPKISLLKKGTDYEFTLLLSEYNNVKRVSFIDYCDIQ